MLAETKVSAAFRLSLAARDVEPRLSELLQRRGGAGASNQGQQQQEPGANGGAGGGDDDVQLPEAAGTFVAACGTRARFVRRF